MVRTLQAIVLGLLAFLVGCLCGGPSTGGGGNGGFPGACSDLDGDGFGVGDGCLGGDCNESVPAIHTDAECAAYCVENENLAPGCPCDGATDEERCYGGPLDTVGIGACRAGSMTCDRGTWSVCNGQVLPEDEVCNEADDDCDGEPDDGVLSACGDCNTDCVEDCLGVGCPDGFDPEVDGASGVVVTPEGGITLDETATVKNHVIWIANSAEGTVTKIDTRTRLETGRYWTGWGGGGDSPSRTTVNTHGDVVVANRGPGGEATKYLASDCPDRNGDGVIETSTGAGDVRAFQSDECWVWTTVVGAGARGSAVEVRDGLDGVALEYVWIGDYAHADVHELDAETGAPTGRVIGGASPYGVAMGPDHTLWTFSSAGLQLLAVDTETLESSLVPLPAGESWYGITVDPVGRVWIGGSTARYDPAAGTWESPGPEVYGGGIACDAAGNAYVGELGGALFGAGGPWRIDADTMEATPIPGAGGHGWAVDFDGYAWSVEFAGTRAFVVDPDTLEVTTVTPPLVGAYTYSDMTGFQLVNATNPVGTYPHVFDSCPEGDVRWVGLSWDAVVPEETSLTFRVRTADDLVALASAPLLDLGTSPPAEGPLSIEDAFDAAGVVPARLLEVQVTLASLDRESAPILDTLRVTRSCAGELN
jgi:streptogramin lyase